MGQVSGPMPWAGNTWQGFWLSRGSQKASYFTAVSVKASRQAAQQNKKSYAFDLSTEGPNAHWPLTNLASWLPGLYNGQNDTHPQRVTLRVNESSM